MYIYCINNPMIYSDPSGNAPENQIIKDIDIYDSNTSLYRKHVESKTIYNEMKMDLFVQLTTNKNFDKEKYITSTRGYGGYMDDVKGHNLQIHVRTSKNSLIKLVDTDYVYSDNIDDINIGFFEVGSYEAMFENGLNLEHLKSIPGTNEIGAGFTMLGVGFDFMDMLHSSYDKSWEIDVTEGDIKITVDSGVGASRTSLVYYINTREHYYIDDIEVAGAKKPFRHSN